MEYSQTPRFTDWIFDTFTVSTKGLALYRIFASLYLLFYLLPSTATYSFLGSLPSDFYAPPPGPFLLLNDFPPAWVMFGLHYLLLGGLVFMLVGYHTKASSIVVGSMLFLLKGIMFGLGKIDHELLMIIVPILMAFSGWGNAYSVDAKRQDKYFEAQSWVLTLLALLIGFMFFTAGFPKILGGWLHINTHATEGHFYKQFFVRQRQDLLATYALNFSGVIWEILDYATIIFEIGFIAAIYRASTTRIFLCFAALFHFSIMLILNIPFLPNFLAYAAFFNWSWLIEIIEKNTSNGTNKKGTYYYPPLMVAASMMLLFLLITYFGRWFHLESDLTPGAVILVSIFACIAFITLVTEALKYLRAKKHSPESS